MLTAFFTQLSARETILYYTSTLPVITSPLSPARKRGWPVRFTPEDVVVRSDNDFGNLERLL